MEVIVVDDGSVAEEEVRNVVASHEHARLIRLGGDGPAAARNAGVQHARSGVLCFTDDDCVPDSHWAERLAEAIEGGADAAAGTTVSSGGRLADASELVARAPAHAGEGDAGGLTFAPSNNLAGARAVFEAIRFDESYPTAAAEDRDWCARAQARGYTLRQAPDARIVHHQELTPRRFLLQQFRYGQGAYRFRRATGGRRPLEPRAFYVALLRRGFDASFSVGLLVGVAQLVTAVGFGRAWVQHLLADRSLTRAAGFVPRHTDGDGR